MRTLKGERKRVKVRRKIVKKHVKLGYGRVGQGVWRSDPSDGSRGHVSSSQRSRQPGSGRGDVREMTYTDVGCRRVEKS